MAARILVVEDDDFIRDVIVASLEDESHVVDAASGAGQVWTYLHRHTPDLILLDMALPEEDGLSICRKLRGMPKTATLPIVFVSAMTQPMYIQAAAQAGGNGFIKKPFDIDNLSATVRRLLAAHREEGCNERVVSAAPNPFPVTGNNHSNN